MRSTDNSFVGMWVPADGFIRQELLTDGRYDEARGDKKSAYQGRYSITGNHTEYWDDTGFTAGGEFIDDVLHHVGLQFFRENLGEVKARAKHCRLDGAQHTQEQS
jgi:hypothetical protein